MGLLSPFKKLAAKIKGLNPAEALFRRLASKYELVSYARVQFVEGGIETKIHTRIQEIESVVPFRPKAKKVGSKVVPVQTRRKAA